MKRFLPLMFLITFLMGLDYATKSWILSLQSTGHLPIEVNAYFNISLAWNHGVSFSFLANAHEKMPYILAGFSTLISIGLFVWMMKEKSFILQTGFAFIISGGLANACDRLAYTAVVDFIQLHYQEYYFPTFNVADICINIGVGLILLEMLILSKTRNKTV